MNRIKVLGIIAIIMGVLAMMAPVVTGLWIAFIVGIFVVVAGLSRLYWAFQAPHMGMMLLMLALAILTLFCGVAMLSNPLFASAILTVILASYFIADGILEITVGFSGRAVSGSGWLVVAGIISMLLGGMIIAQFPLSGAWAIGILFGIKLLFVGVIMLMANVTVRTVAAKAAKARKSR